MVYYVIKNACNVVLISTRKCYICSLTILSVAQTTVEGMDNKFNNYSQRTVKEADVMKADLGICLEVLRQITKNLRR